MWSNNGTSSFGPTLKICRQTLMLLKSKAPCLKKESDYFYRKTDAFVLLSESDYFYICTYI